MQEDNCVQAENNLFKAYFLLKVFWKEKFLKSQFSDEKRLNKLKPSKMDYA